MQRWIDGYVLPVLTAAMPITIILMAMLYPWALLFELLGEMLGFSWGHRLRRMLDGQEEPPGIPSSSG